MMKGKNVYMKFQVFFWQKSILVSTSGTHYFLGKNIIFDSPHNSQYFQVFSFLICLQQILFNWVHTSTPWKMMHFFREIFAPSTLTKLFPTNSNKSQVQHAHWLWWERVQIVIGSLVCKTFDFCPARAPHPPKNKRSQCIL